MRVRGAALAAALVLLLDARQADAAATGVTPSGICACTGVNTGINTSYLGPSYGKQCGTWDANKDYCANTGTAWAVPLGANAGKRIEGISGSAAAPSAVNYLADCKTKCENDADCWAIQFSPSEFKVSKNCWYFTQAEFLADSLYQTPSNFLTIKQHHFDRTWTSSKPRQQWCSEQWCYVSSTCYAQSHADSHQSIFVSGLYYNYITCNRTAIVDKLQNKCFKGSHCPRRGEKCHEQTAASGANPRVTACISTNPGYIANLDMMGEAGCKPGTSAPVKNSLSCAPCADGKFQTQAANANCDCVQPGYTQAPNRTAQIQCGYGTYNNVSLCGKKCLACPAGRLAPGLGRAWCDCAQLGHVPTAGARTQAPCGKGTFMNTTCGAACLPCEEGTYAPGTGRAICDLADAGYVPHANKQSLVGCGAGTYMNHKGGASCYKCRNGTYSSNAVNSDCYCAPKGRYPNTARTAFVMCEKGYIAPQNCSTECTLCGPGRVAATRGSHTCLCAKAGYVGSPNRTVEVPCGPGTYQNESCGETCKVCEVGRYSSTLHASQCGCSSPGYTPVHNGTGNTAQKPCAPGTFSDKKCMLQCTACRSGKYSKSGASQCLCSDKGYTANHNSTAQTACPIGTYNNKSCGLACLACPKGLLAHQKGTHDCRCAKKGWMATSNGTKEESCPLGEFQDEECGVACKKCAAGKVARQLGAQACSCSTVGHVASPNRSALLECPVGTFMNHTGCACPQSSCPESCYRCSAGTYSKVSAAKACICAKAGYIANDGRNDTVACGAGTYQNNSCGKACEVCEDGKYSPNAVNSQCNCAAPGYRAAPNKTFMIACNAGTYAPDWCAVGCKLCERGKSQHLKGSRGCTRCARGTSANKSGSPLEHCPGCTPGTYADEFGLQSCKLCARGKSQELPGAWNCTECLAGYHQDELGQAMCKLNSAGHFTAGRGAHNDTFCGYTRYALGDSKGMGATECGECLSYATSFGLSAPGFSILPDVLTSGQCACTAWVIWIVLIILALYIVKLIRPLFWCCDSKDKHKHKHHHHREHHKHKSHESHHAPRKHAKHPDYDDYGDEEAAAPPPVPAPKPHRHASHQVVDLDSAAAPSHHGHKKSHKSHHHHHGASNEEDAMTKHVDEWTE